VVTSVSEKPKQGKGRGGSRGVNWLDTNGLKNNQLKKVNYLKKGEDGSLELGQPQSIIMGKEAPFPEGLVLKKGGRKVGPELS